MGNLMYCMACVDGKIASKEWKELKRLVQEELVPKEEHQDDFGTDAAYAVEFQFDVLEGNNVSFAEAWDELETYLKRNAALLPEKDRKRLLDAGEQVASAFHGISKTEHQQLQKLRNLL